MIEKLFVYGTLGPGRPNEHILADIGGTWENATIIGSLKQEGWGAEMGYPGIVFDDSGNVINGFVFSSKNLSSHWGVLDKFEGESYQRILVKVTLNDERTIEANIYALK